jgi:hypothetical protein
MAENLFDVLVSGADFSTSRKNRRTARRMQTPKLLLPFSPLATNAIVRVLHKQNDDSDGAEQEPEEKPKPRAPACILSPQRAKGSE